MKALFATRVSLVWFFLVGATMTSWYLDQGHVPGTSQYTGIAILVIAFLKVRFVISEFMETRFAPSALKLAGDGWCILVCGLLIGLFLRAT
jgi:cytochrome c oxidase subunit IV